VVLVRFDSAVLPVHPRLIIIRMLDRVKCSSCLVNQT
jgi:hypothetical protein